MGATTLPRATTREALVERYTPLLSHALERLTWAGLAAIKELNPEPPPLLTRVDVPLILESRDQTFRVYYPAPLHSKTFQWDRVAFRTNGTAYGADTGENLRIENRANAMGTARRIVSACLMAGEPETLADCLTRVEGAITLFGELRAKRVAASQRMAEEACYQEQVLTETIITAHAEAFTALEAQLAYQALAGEEKQ